MVEPVFHGRRRTSVTERHLTPTQLFILEAITTLKSDAYGLAILDEVNARLPPEYRLDQAQVYVTLKRLVIRGFIAVVETRRTQNSPPLKIYAVTEAGLLAKQPGEARSAALLRALNPQHRDGTP